MYLKKPDIIPDTRLSGFEYTYSLDTIEQKIDYLVSTEGLLLNKKRKSLLSVPITFDIETTTLPENNEYNPCDYMLAFPYLYQLYLCNTVFFCRTRTECYLLFSEIERCLLKHDIHAVCYVHNLSFEYQFLKSILRINYEKVFLIKNRKVAKFELESDTIIFKDSYLLSNMSLAKFCENYNTEKYQKDKELIDYEVLRYPWTELSDEILYYSGMDVITLYYAIMSIMQKEGDTLKTIPMTNTGYVRRSYKKACLGSTYNGGGYRKKSDEKTKVKKTYRQKYMYKQQITLEQYNILLKAFRGGNTHANRYKVGRILHNITSYDFASSYPAVIICCAEFPMGKLMDCTNDLKNSKDIEYYIKNYWVLFQCLFEDVSLRDNERTPVPYIPKSKIITEKYDGIYDNGRIITQKSPFEFCFLGCEYPIIKKQYKGKMKIIKAYYTQKDYLPVEIRKECAEWYKKKTELKGVDGSEYEYMKSKNRVNSSYGMMVESIVKDVLEIDEKTGELNLRKPTEEEAEKQIKSYYEPKQGKFLQYQWGVTVTALARVRLQSLIDLTYKDFVYADTDSVKIENGKKYLPLMEHFNKDWVEYAEKCNVPFKAYTIKDEEQILGIADFDGFYNRFITLGAKKYAYESDDKQKDGTIKKNVLHITIAGVPKKLGAKLLGNLENFKCGMRFMIGADGTLEDRQNWKKRLLYNDDENRDITIDGHSLHIGTYIAMERTAYELSISDEYEELLNSLEYETIIEKDDIYD